MALIHGSQVKIFALSANKELGEEIPMPITFSEFTTQKRLGRNIDAFLFDDLDSCLSIYAHNGPIKTGVFEKTDEGE